MFLDSINFPDIVLITEHWLKKGESIVIPGYSILSIYCRTESVHGGTLILVNQHFLNKNDFVNVSKYDHLIVEKEFEFSILCNLESSVFIICIYRPPSADLTQFIYRLEDLLLLFSPQAMILLAGDLNINFNDKKSTGFQLISSLLSSFNLTMHVESATRITSSSCSLVDYVCSNFDGCICNVVNAGISDHEAVHVRFKTRSKIRVQKPSIKKGRIFSTNNFDLFSEHCRNIDWNAIHTSEEPLNKFHNILKTAFDSCFKLRKIKNKKRTLWFTKGLKISSKNMRSLHQIRKHMLNNTFFMSYYYAYRKIYRSTINLAKNLYYMNRLRNAKNKQKESWNIVNELLEKYSETATGDNLDPNLFNSFYSKVALELLENVDNGLNPSEYLSSNLVSHSFFLKPTDVEEIQNCLRDISNKNSTGWDDISIKVFLKLPDIALETLAEAINLSFSAGIFPACLKKALIRPLFKKGDRDLPLNYRPIALLPTLAKIVERLVKYRMLEFLSAQNILSNEQFGFQESRGTNDAIFSFLETLYLSLNEGDFAAAAFCDLSKAFECVDHSILLWKLECYGFRGSTLRWFKSYLSDRCQSVIIGSKQSNNIRTNTGVPQGSVLGPVLFLIYVNDLLSLKIHGKFIVFADDITVLWHTPDSNTLQTKMNIDLPEILKWCHTNRLTFNITKTNIISFKSYLPNVLLNSTSINIQTDCKYLGLYIDSSLKFDIHIDILHKRLSCNCFSIRILANELEKNIARNAYFALFESHLRYGICFWGSCSRYLFNSIFLLQKRALRYLCKVRSRVSCRDLFKNEKILTLTNIYILETACLIKRKYNNEVYSQSAYNTRLTHVVKLPIPSSSLIKNSIVFGGKKIFNHLPACLRQISNGDMFRRQTKKFLIDKPYYSLNEFLEDDFS